MTPEQAALVDADEVDTPFQAEARRQARVREAKKRQATALRKVRIMELRRAGLTFAEIGQQLDISAQAAHKAYRSALKDHYKAASEEERETALLRVDGVIRRWWPRLVHQDDEIADRATKNLMRALDFQADLWGMKRTNVHVELEASLKMPTGAEVWQALQEYRQQALAREAEGAGTLDATAAIELPSAQVNGTNGNGYEP